VRAATEAQAVPLSPEDCALQSMPDASPVKWHLAHTSWFFETFLLEAALPAYRHFDPHYRVLFNSYYQSIGEQFSRPRRGLLSRPPLEEVLAYRRHVDRHVEGLLRDEHALTPALRDVVALGLHHEQQHQELILSDVKHLLAQNPLRPAYRKAEPIPRGNATPLGWQRFEEGLRVIGHSGGGFAFDNESPAHRVFLEAYLLASRPVSNAEYLTFLEAGGYAEPGYWTSDGFNWVRERGIEAPLYWERRDAAWCVQTLAGLEPLRPEDPVCHVSWYEADAYARFAGARLPTKPNGRPPRLAPHSKATSRRTACCTRARRSSRAPDPCGSSSATSGSGRPAPTRPTPATPRRRARSASTTPSSWRTR
jgi:ergothioneine biosynthesis protein EgtB